MEQKSHGALIGSIIIIVLLVIGGVYLYKTSLKQKIYQQNNPTTEQNASDDLSDLQVEIDGADIDIDEDI